MEWPDHRVPTGLGELRKWRLVARPQHSLCYRQGNRGRGAKSLERLVERANCVTPGLHLRLDMLSLADTFESCAWLN